MAGPLDELNQSFIARLYLPLGFIPIVKESEDFPPDSNMIEYLGRLAKGGQSRN